MIVYHALAAHAGAIETRATSKDSLLFAFTGRALVTPDSTFETKDFPQIAINFLGPTVNGFVLSVKATVFMRLK